MESNLTKDDIYEPEEDTNVEEAVYLFDGDVFTKLTIQDDMECVAGNVNND